MTSKIPLIFGLIFAVSFVAPLVVLFAQTFSLNTAFRELALPSVLSAISSTIWPSALGIGGAVALGTAYAWIVHRTDVPGRRFLSILPLLGLTQPSEVRGIGLVFLFSPVNGAVNVIFDAIFHVNFPLFNVFTNWGLVFAHIAGGFPFSYLLISATLSGMDSSLEESARLAGSSVFKTLRRITLPLLWPAIVSAFLVGLSVAMANFDYPFILGQGASSGVNTLATAVYDAIEEMAPPQYPSAVALSLIYIAITFVVVTAYILSIRKSYRYTTVFGNRITQTHYSLQRWKWLAVVICLAIITVTFFLEAFIVAFVSVLPNFSFASNTISLMSLSNYNKLFSGYPLFWSALQNSLILALTVGVVTALVSTVTAYVVVKSRFRGAKIFEYFNTLPYAIPGVVYGLAMLWFVLAIPLLAKYIYGTIWILWIALVITWMPYSIRLIAPSLLQISNEMEESAATAGAKWIRIYRTVLLPLLKVSGLTAFTYVFLDVFRELGIVALLTTPGSYTLTTFIADLYTASAGQFPIIAATATIMTILAGLFILFASEVLGVNLLGPSVRQRSIIDRLRHRNQEPEEKEDKPVEVIATVGAAIGS